MRSGDLKKVISIERHSSTSDGMGGVTEAWTDIISGTSTATPIFAAVWPVSAKEHIQAMQEQTVISHRIRVRYRPGVSTAMRIKYGTKLFNITSVVNVGSENRMLDILCQEVA